MLSTEIDFESLKEFRHFLHAHPSISNDEQATAQIIVEKLRTYAPDILIENLGGCGVAAVFDSQRPGPVVALRCELDALPIIEENTFDYRSKQDGVSHKCGHDGHMAILCGVAELLSKQKLSAGKVVLLFQPAEETGEGARRIMHDKRFLELRPDWIFAVHNYPQIPFGQIMVRSGTTTCGSFGLSIKLSGASSHAAYPDEAVSPQGALCELLSRLPLLASEVPSSAVNLVSITHASLGVPSFGIVPGDAVIQAVFRSDVQETLDTFRRAASGLIEEVTNRFELHAHVTEHDYFPVGSSMAEACELFLNAAKAEGLSTVRMPTPFRWSEDFSYYTKSFPGALAALGAGETCPPLHSPSYDFPDELLAVGVKLFDRLIKETITRFR